LQTTSIGSVFGSLVAGLQASDPVVFEILAGDVGSSLVRNIASHQRVLGQLLSYADEASATEIVQIGWLIAALAEISISWQDAIGCAQGFENDSKSG
jgi:hypothetical protein